jgi:hypothetical protein
LREEAEMGMSRELKVKSKIRLYSFVGNKERVDPTLSDFPIKIIYDEPSRYDSAVLFATERLSAQDVILAHQLLEKHDLTLVSILAFDVNHPIGIEAQNQSQCLYRCAESNCLSKQSILHFRTNSTTLGM